MTVVIVLVILIVLVTVVLIFGGSAQRGNNRRIEKENKVAKKEILKEIKEKQREIQKASDTYVDILKISTESVEEVKNTDADSVVEAIEPNATMLNNEIEDIAIEEVSDEDIIFSEFINSDNMFSEEITNNDTAQGNVVNVKINATNIEEENAEEVKNVQETDNVDESEDITFLFNNDKEENVIDTLDMYIKEAQAKDIGYLNGNGPDLEDSKSVVEDESKEKAEEEKKENNN